MLNTQKNTAVRSSDVSRECDILIVTYTKICVTRCELSHETIIMPYAPTHWHGGTAIEIVAYLAYT